MHIKDSWHWAEGEVVVEGRRMGGIKWETFW